MASGEVKRSGGKAEAFSVSALLVLSAGCALLLLSQERALIPDQLPVLSLPADQVTRVTKEDAALAKQAPSGPAALELDALLFEYGEAEAAITELLTTHLARRKAFVRVLSDLVQQEGDLAPLRMRARAVERLEAALELRLPEEQLPGVMGSFANLLQKNKVTRDGEVVAPHFVVRVLYKARWNLLHGLEPSHRFAKVEQLAYHGWLALHVENMPVGKRLDALEAYAAAGGERVAEARGVLLFKAKDYRLAAKELKRAYEISGSLRVRNYLLGAQVAAGLTNP